MNITDQDKELITLAKSLVKKEVIPGGVVGEVGAAMRTTDGEVFSGVCMHLVCGLGFCAEHTAIANAVTKSTSVEIDTIVAVNSIDIIPPCGRCRELMNVLSENSSKTQVIMSEQEKVPLTELLPRAWSPVRAKASHPEA